MQSTAVDFASEYTDITRKALKNTTTHIYEGGSINKATSPLIA
jgi:hypothetical protein